MAFSRQTSEIAKNIEAQNSAYEEHYFDYIILGGALVQAADPLSLLRQVKKYLKSDGSVLAYIPNMNYFLNICRILNGKWAYTDDGNELNLQPYFTLPDIVRLFSDAGYKLPLCMGIKHIRSKEDNDFIEALCKLSHPENSKQFETSHYLIKATINNSTINNLPEKKRKYVILFPEAENVHLTKDVGMIAYILYKYFNYDSHIACYKNGEYPYLDNEVKGLKIDFIDNYIGDAEEDGKRYIIENAKDIDVLQLFHLSKRSLNWIYIYKKLNPKGKVYLKLDACVQMKQTVFNDTITGILKLCDIISVECRQLYDYFNENWPVRVEYIPNGFYDHGRRRPVLYEEKENIICTVGRIGAAVKANHILMEAFKYIAPILPDWKLKLIGPVEDSFKDYLKKFFDENKDIADRVILTGEITDKSVLDGEYRKAKIFCLTSYFEGFPLVFCEAVKNGCYIISTDLVPAFDITDNQKLGDLFDYGNIPKLSGLLVNICSNEQKLRECCTAIQNFAYDNYYWVDICKKLDSLISHS